MHFGERLRQIREKGRLSQNQVGEWEGISKQGIYNREQKENPVVGLAQVAKLLDETNTDARYLFGQIQDLSLSDMSMADAPKLFAQMLHDYKEMKRQEELRRSGDSIGARVDADEKLRRIVTRLLSHRSSFDRIEGYIDALDENEKREFEERRRA